MSVVSVKGELDRPPLHSHLNNKGRC